MIRRSHWKRRLALLCILVLAGSVLTACNGSKDKDNNSKKQTDRNSSVEHTRKPLETLEDPSANLGHWGRAMGSVLIAINEGNVYYFGGYEQTDGNKEAAARILKQSWNITDRTELLRQIQALLNTGDRKEYRKEAGEMKAMSKKELKTALKQLSGDTLTHYNMVQYNWKKWKKKGLLAWDMCRVSHLAQWGYVAGFISIEEAQALIEPAAQKLAQKFDNWDDVQQNWLDGYALYATIDAENPAGTDYEVRMKKYEELKEGQKGAQKLYDDSLFTAGIIPLSGVSADVILAEVAEQEEPQVTKSPGNTEDSGQETTEEPENTEKPGKKATKEPGQKETKEPDKTKEPERTSDSN